MRILAVWFVVFTVVSSSAQAPDSQPTGPKPAEFAALQAYFAAAPEARPGLPVPCRDVTDLTGTQAAAWRAAVWQSYVTADGPEQRQRRADFVARQVTAAKGVRRYDLRVVGEKPATGWPVFVCLPDGAVTDGAAAPGLYVHPASDEDGTCSWITPDDYGCFESLAQQLVARAEADSNRVHLLGHGTAAVQAARLGPNLADLWAAVAVLGPLEDPGRLPLENLRNTPLFLRVSSADAEEYARAAAWADRLKKLKDDANPGEYNCDFAPLPESPAAVPNAALTWLANVKRDPVPRRIVWTQAASRQRERYWLRVDPGRDSTRTHQTIDARVGGQCVTLNVRGYDGVTLRLDDRLVNLDKPVTITVNDEEAFTGRIARSATPLVKTLLERGDPELMFCAELELSVPPARVAKPTARPVPAFPRPTDEKIAQQVADALGRAGDNQAELIKALEQVDAAQWPGLHFLIANLPDRDLLTMQADYLLENTRLAYEARQKAPWSAQVPEQLFLQYILPFAHLNERRDNWRRDFYDRFREKAWQFRDPVEAGFWLATTLNDAVNVHYHAHKRPKSDQSPYESIAAEFASCSGLSILLADACRAVGIPARLVGVPQWLGDGGNHTWVEIWGGPPDDDALPIVRRWHYVGDTASDPRKDDWVHEACRKNTDVNQPRYSVYAVPFRRTDRHFPLAWDAEIKYVPGLNVTRFYTQLTDVEVAIPGGGAGDVQVFWADELLLTARGHERVALRLAGGETYRAVITAPDGTRREENLAP
jgi:hypothetical protein